MTKTAVNRSSRRAQVAVDICLALVLVFIQATALVDEVPHEWLGIAVFALIVAHIVLARKRIVALTCGRKTAWGVFQLLLDALLVVAIIGQIASSVVLSKHAFSWLPVIPGAFWARTTHLLCGYWVFALAFIHAGLHMKRLPSIFRKNAMLKWCARIAIAALSLAGLWFFIQMGVPMYLLLQSQFAFVDFSVSLIARFAEWACVGIMFMAFGSIVAIVRSISDRKSSRSSIGTTDKDRRSFSRKQVIK